MYDVRLIHQMAPRYWSRGYWLAAKAPSDLPSASALACFLRFHGKSAVTATTEYGLPRRAEPDSLIGARGAAHVPRQLQGTADVVRRTTVAREEVIRRVRQLESDDGVGALDQPR